jgi:hypothetical protein
MGDQCKPITCESFWKSNNEPVHGFPAFSSAPPRWAILVVMFTWKMLQISY